MDVDTTRIVLLAKTGTGKSSLGNTIFGEAVFEINCHPKSQTSLCKAVSKPVNGRSITLVDTPGLFDTEMSEEQLKPEILRCITECAPGPHVFLIMLKVEKYTEQEEAVVKKIVQYFSEEAFRYAAVVFTHGDQLPEGMTIQQVVSKNKSLSDLVKKCGGRCHVVDNKYWNNNQQDPYRSNQFQVAELLNTVDKIVEDNKGGCYTNEVLQAVERKIQEEMENITKSSGNLSKEEIREKAKINVWQRILIQSAAVTTGALLGALLGLAVTGVASAIVVVKCLGLKEVGQKVLSKGGAVGGTAGGGAAEAAAGGAAAAAGAAGTAGIVLGITAAVVAGAGAVAGGVTGYNAAKEAETAGEAAGKAAKAVWNKAEAALNKVSNTCDKIMRPNQDKKDQ